MSKKVTFLMVLGLMLAMTGSDPSAFQLKVDLCFKFDGEPDPATWKGSDPGFEDWIPWPIYADSEAHNAINFYNVGGSGTNVGIANTPHGAHQRFLKTLGGEEKICNSWITSENSDGAPMSNSHLVMWSTPDGLVPGSYTMYGYHNNPDGK